MRYAADAEKCINYDRFSVPAFESGQYLIRTFDGSYDMLVDEKQNNWRPALSSGGVLSRNLDAVMAADNGNYSPLCFRTAL